MIRTDKILGLLAEKRMSQKEMAEKIGIAPKTFYDKMQKGVFGSDEIEVMIETLGIEDPAAIFFAKEVTYKDTGKEAHERPCGAVEHLH